MLRDSHSSSMFKHVSTKHRHLRCEGLWYFDASWPKTCFRDSSQKPDVSERFEQRSFGFGLSFGLLGLGRMEYAIVKICALDVS